jgi:cytosine/adenosine deaminase-related metal-dependent hydrolase
LDVGLGTDGPSSGNTLDLFVQMNLVAKIHKLENHDRSLFKAKEILHLATLGGAKVLQLSHEIGSLEVGKKADLVLLETKSINMFPMHDPFSVMVYSANPSNVHSVWVDGIQKVKNKTLVDVDIETLKTECLNTMDQFLKQVSQISKTIK